MVCLSPLPRLGLALKLADETRFRSAVHTFLNVYKEEEMAVNIGEFFSALGKSTALGKGRKLKHSDRIETNGLQLRALEEALRLLFLPYGNAADSVTAVLKPEITQDWLSGCLTHPGWYEKYSKEQACIISTMSRWLFWLTALDWGDGIDSFCLMLGYNRVDSGKVKTSLLELLGRTKFLLWSAYSLLNLEPHPKLVAMPCNPESWPEGRKHPSVHTNDKSNARANDLPALEVITSSAPSEDVENTAAVYHAVARIEIRLRTNGPSAQVVLDTGCSSSIIDRALLLNLHPMAQIQQLPKPFESRTASGHNITEAHYAMVDMFLPATVHGKPALAHLKQQLQVMDSLSSGVLFGEDIIKQHGMIIDAVTDTITITRCKNAKIPVVTKIFSLSQRLEAVSKEPAHRATVRAMAAQPENRLAPAYQHSKNVQLVVA